MADEDPERVDRKAAKRQSDRAEIVEGILDDVETDLGDSKYPVRSEELAETYADQPIDLPNETESLGDVFDRLGQEFDSREDIREALYGEVTGDAAGPEEYNRERDLEEIDEVNQNEDQQESP